MATYSIKELEQLSGIKAHTIRIWEQRYKLLQPRRTQTNIRFYTDADLKTLLNVSLLNEKGIKISRIAGLSPEQLSAEVMNLSAASGDKEVQINALVIATIEMHEEKIERILSTAVLQFGFEECMLKVVYPFLQKVGILWQASKVCPAHEHFVCNLIRQKLIVAIDGQVMPNRDTSRRYLLFLPEGEWHELSLLFMHFLLRTRGHHVMYLGQSLPLSDLETANNCYKANYLVTIFTSVADREEVRNYLQKILELIPEIPVLAYGYPVWQATAEFPARIKKLQYIQDFISEIGAE